MSDDIVEHPTAKKMRADAALASQTVEMLGKDRSWLEAQLETAQARIVTLEEALKKIASLDYKRAAVNMAATKAVETARAAPTRAKPIRRTVEDADEALRRLGDGDTIKFSQDGDDAWFTKGDKAFIGDAAIWSLRNRGLIVRKCDDEDNYRGMSEYDAISDVGRAYLAILDKTAQPDL